jgi:hypothetical protein
MCKWGTTVPLRLKTAPFLSSSDKEKWRVCGIDKCIAPIVKALQAGGINMLGSCCGHGKGPGEITLRDGRTIWIKPWNKRLAKNLEGVERPANPAEIMRSYNRAKKRLEKIKPVK